MTGRPAPLSPDAGRAVAGLLDEYSRRNERWISSARGLFCVAALARRAWLGGLWDGTRVPPSAFIAVPAVLGAAIFSWWMVRRSRRPGLPTSLLGVSATVDAVASFLALATNPIAAHPLYAGVFAHPDIVVVPLMVALAGFRMAPRVALIGVVLNGASLVGVVLLDHWLVPNQLRPMPGAVALVVMCVGGVAALSMSVARRTRTLAESAAVASAQVERARRGIGVLLEEHHDLKSTISSAHINAELMLRELVERGALDDEGRAHAEQLAADLKAASSAVRELRGRVLGEAPALDPPAPARIATAARRAASIVLARRAQERRDGNTEGNADDAASAITVDVDSIDESLEAIVNGGVIALERVLLNLVANACEGDGVRGARRVEVRARKDGDVVVVEVIDDGPGIPSPPPRPGASAKRGGSGLGLVIVDTVVRGSGGALHLGAAAGGAGARVEVRLRAAGDDGMAT